MDYDMRKLILLCENEEKLTRIPMKGFDAECAFTASEKQQKQFLADLTSAKKLLAKYGIANLLMSCHVRLEMITRDYDSKKALDMISAVYHKKPMDTISISMLAGTDEYGSFLEVLLGALGYRFIANAGVTTIHNSQLWRDTKAMLEECRKDKELAQLLAREHIILPSTDHFMDFFAECFKYALLGKLEYPKLHKWMMNIISNYRGFANSL